jgi:hypothetical protein
VAILGFSARTVKYSYACIFLVPGEATPQHGLKTRRHGRQHGHRVDAAGCLVSKRAWHVHIRCALLRSRLVRLVTARAIYAGDSLRRAPLPSPRTRPELHIGAFSSMFRRKKSRHGQPPIRSIGGRPDEVDTAVFFLFILRYDGYVIFSYFEFVIQYYVVYMWRHHSS